ncbi:MAG: Xanthine and dehydrogenase maturation factor, XdhC/CoxF family [Devosia sp.]|uniref:XdhC family protein n=1 Tax=Devosia sp. TaxID=1871048 RepID=UPI00260DD5ED|nr:XdhC family protein [Devosia sp.]MDB5541109.1 Xanthine and dehydrogenase maturation factor, XdhC/CoxF family [Devosia sp.]
MTNQQLAPTLPRRLSQAGDIAPDDSASVFGLLRRGLGDGVRGALLTLVDSVGGSARPVGAQMAVLEDGRFAGYLSSGCLESAIATEAMELMRQQRNAILRFGAGSPFLDIRLPCGGSMDVLVDTGIDEALVETAGDHLAARRPFAIVFDPNGPAALEEGDTRQTGWHEDTFRRCYPQQLQLVVLGRGLEFEALARLGAAAGYRLRAFAADDQNAVRLIEAGIDCDRLLTPRDPPDLRLDSRSAVVLLFHEHEWETAILRQALGADCLYIGALGSTRTHQRRCEVLLACGHTLAEIDRIRGPIGLFGPTRDASSLAISVLAELAQLVLHDQR